MGYYSKYKHKCIVLEQNSIMEKPTDEWLKTHDEAYVKRHPELRGWLRIVCQDCDDIIKSTIRTGKLDDPRCTVSQYDILGEDLIILKKYLDEYACHNDSIEDEILDCFYRWTDIEDSFQGVKFKAVCEELGIEPRLKRMESIWVHAINEAEVDAVRKIMKESGISYDKGEYKPVFSPYINSYFPLSINLMKRTSTEVASNITCLAAHASHMHCFSVNQLSSFYLGA